MEDPLSQPDATDRGPDRGPTGAPTDAQPATGGPDSGPVPSWRGGGADRGVAPRSKRTEYSGHEVLIAVPPFAEGDLADCDIVCGDTCDDVDYGDACVLDAETLAGLGFVIGNAPVAGSTPMPTPPVAGIQQ